MNISQGVALGFQLFTPSGLPVTGTYPLETARNPKKRRGQETPPTNERRFGAGRYFVISREVVLETTVRNFADWAIHSIIFAFVAIVSRKAARRSDEGVLSVMRCV